ncbi:D-glucuronyl C5-epimerase family protein [Actinokineospora fastidiosa]|uniref:D-glucuronyl C5-epimerase C-terminal domain-containing protein n=1 Tax=Actinokineospora fastidiosa TaxID=1816 RepID=A0A918GIG8_9PSEU|nr:D-glucuronyl C5-epimerase family protein [Actinokineospora fastidiosa]GGS38156.1 hypothetical protein GCM10010171_36330 [Actinokineospora fastidiosa]
METRSEAMARPPLGTYAKTSYTPRPLDWESLPYNSSTLNGYDQDVPRDASGVRMYLLDGVLYDHPVAQAQDALMALSDYHLSGEARYLNRAVLDAQRLIDRRVLSDGAWYYPYPFDFLLHGDSREVMRAPWFSGMAQGQALSLFTRLHQVTGEQRWLAAAHATFASFRNAPVEGLPSVVDVDAAGYLWLEEYPRWPMSTSDRALNGHVFAVFGLYDYQRLTGDQTALDLWNGALAHTRWYLDHGFRSPQYISHYCLAHPWVLSAKYHEIHWNQMLLLHAGTGDAAWSRSADLLRADYPPPAVGGTVKFAAGSHTGYKFSASGEITASKTIDLNAPSSAPADLRQRIKGRDIMLRITAGGLAGYWVPENYPRTGLAGIKLSLTYPLPRTVMIPAGTWSAYQFDSAGTPTASRTITPDRTTSAPFSTSATINGRWHILVTAGSLAGYWLPAQGLTLL